MIPFIKCPLYSTLCLVPCSTPHSTLVSQTIGAWFAPGGSLVRACAAGALRTGGAASGCTGTQCGWQPGALYVHGTAPAAPPIVPALQPNTVRPVQRTACNTRRPNTRLRCRTLLHPTPSLSPQAADAPPCAPRPSAFARGCAALLRKACRPARAEAGRARCSGSGGAIGLLGSVLGFASHSQAVRRQNEEDTEAVLALKELARAVRSSSVAESGFSWVRPSGSPPLLRVADPGPTPLSVV